MPGSLKPWYALGFSGQRGKQTGLSQISDMGKWGDYYIYIYVNVYIYILYNYVYIYIVYMYIVYVAILSMDKDWCPLPNKSPSGGFSTVYCRPGTRSLTRPRSLDMP